MNSGRSYIIVGFHLNEAHALLSSSFHDKGSLFQLTLYSFFKYVLCSVEV